MNKTNIYNILAILFSYPGQDYKEKVCELENLLQKKDKELIQPFLSFIQKSDQGQIEEQFTYTFDMNPDTCLEIGWHLFGEDYQRGQFLVHMRQSLREQGILESVELPDHLSHCLLLLSKMERSDAEIFVKNYLLKPLEKIVRKLDKENVYKSLIQFLINVLFSDMLQKEPVSQ